MTARCVVDEVAPRRDLRLTWQPISLLFKNEPEPGSTYHEVSLTSHRMLRVMEALRAGEAAGRTGPGSGTPPGADPSADPVFRWYWQTATRIHHDRDRTFDLGDALAAAGLARGYAAAAHDDTWDAEIRARMDAGLALVGNDVGTPIIAFAGADGTTRGIFGPVVTRVPDTEQALAMWDATVTLISMDGFWELKRTRTAVPEFGSRPAV